MIKGIAKRKLKKDVCHFVIVLEVVFQKWFPLEGVKPQVKKKQIGQSHEDKRRKEILREKFIKNKKPLNLAHLSPKKEK